MRWFLVLAAAGCYSPREFRHCEIECMPNTSFGCPTGFDCLPNGNRFRCHEQGVGACPMDATEPPQGNCVGHDAPPFVRFCDSQLPVAFKIPEILRAEEGIDTTMCDVTLAQSFPGHELCVRVGLEVDINMVVRVQGPRPLLLVAMNEMLIRGRIDASAANGGLTTPADANFGQSPPGVAADRDGGAGGSFLTMGGFGGEGNSTSGAIMPEAATETPTFVRGGGRGGAGSDPQAGPSGSSGGAVYLLAGKGMLIRGAITVSGAGGIGGGQLHSGGGGGSGGMIVLEAMTITIDPFNGNISALGGGGGAGGNGGAMGDSGEEPVGTTIVGMGGNGPAPGGDGGGLGVLTFPGKGSNSTSAAGGGGGSSGHILVFPADTFFPPGTLAPRPGP